MQKKTAISFILLLGLTFCSSQSQVADNRLLGSINGKKFTVDTFISTIVPKEQIVEAKKQLNDTMLQDIFQKYTNTYVLAKTAEKNGFYNDIENKTTLQNTIKDIEVSVYRYFILSSVLKPLTDKANVPDKDLEVYTKQVQVRHILFSQENIDKNPDKIKKLTASILKDIKSGVPFSKLANKYSEDPGSKDNGGLIEGWINPESPYVENFKKAALSATKEKEVIPNVNTEFGQHIIYIEKIKNQSIQEIRKKNKPLVDEILQRKKMAIQTEFNKNLIEKKYKGKFTINLTNFKEFQNNLLEKVKLDTVIVDINNQYKFTIKDFLDKFLGGSTQRVSQLTQPMVQNALETQYIMPHLYILLAKEKNADNNSDVKNLMEQETNTMKGAIYINHLMVEAHLNDKKTTLPNITDKEVENFYTQHKNDYFTSKDKTGKTSIIPFDDNLKAQIKQWLSQQQQQQQQQGQQQKQDAFIQDIASKHYKEYNVSLEKLTPIKKKDNK